MIHGAAMNPSTLMTASAAIATELIASVARWSSRLVVLDVERHERRGEDAAEQQLVDDVRRRVRDVVDVGEAREAERRERGDAEEAGDPRERGAEPDDRAGPDEAVLGAARRAGSVTCASVAGRMGWRRLRRQWVIHQMARNRPAPIVRKTPTPLTTVERTV